MESISRNIPNRGFNQQVESLRTNAKTRVDNPFQMAETELSYKLELSAIQDIDTVMMKDGTDADQDPRPGVVRITEEGDTKTACAGGTGVTYERAMETVPSDPSKPSLYKWHSNDGNMAKSLLYQENISSEQAPVVVSTLRRDGLGAILSTSHLDFQSQLKEE